MLSTFRPSYCGIEITLTLSLTIIFLAPEARSRRCLHKNYISGPNEKDLPDGHGLVGVQVRLALGAQEFINLALALKLAAKFERRDSLLCL